MRRYRDQILHSAGERNAFLGCAHAVVLNARALDDPELRARRAVEEGSVKLTQDAGHAHEAAYRDALAGVVTVPDPGSLEDRASATIAALNAWSYKVIDTKLPRSLIAKRPRDARLVVDAAPGRHRLRSEAGRARARKAINNLLAEVEVVAAGQGFACDGAKKLTANDPETYLNGTVIRDRHRQQRHQAGAAPTRRWHRLAVGTRRGQTFDCLFVDEAGQVALGHLLAMASVVRDVIDRTNERWRGLLAGAAAARRSVPDDDQRRRTAGGAWWHKPGAVSD